MMIINNNLILDDWHFILEDYKLLQWINFDVSTHSSLYLLKYFSTLLQQFITFFHRWKNSWEFTNIATLRKRQLRSIPDGFFAFFKRY